MIPPEEESAQGLRDPNGASFRDERGAEKFACVRCGGTKGKAAGARKYEAEFPPKTGRRQSRPCNNCTATNNTNYKSRSDEGDESGNKPGKGDPGGIGGGSGMVADSMMRLLIAASPADDRLLPLCL